MTRGLNEPNFDRIKSTQGGQLTLKLTKRFGKLRPLILNPALAYLAKILKGFVIPTVSFTTPLNFLCGSD